jgi:hypothetical protein
MKNYILFICVLISTSVFSQDFNTLVDYKNPLIIETSKSVVKSDKLIGKVCEIYDYCKSKWKFVNYETKRNASTILQSGYEGNYSDFTTLVSAMILASGGQVRLTSIPDKHIFAEVNLGTLDSKQFQYVDSFIDKRYKSPYALCGRWDDKNTDLWINLDLNAGYPAGPYYISK